MTGALLLPLQALLLAAIFQTIICQSTDIFASRQDRATQFGASIDNSFDYTNRFRENSGRKNVAFNTERRQQQQVQQEDETSPERTTTSKPISTFPNKDFVFPDQTKNFGFDAHKTDANKFKPVCKERLSEGLPFCTAVQNYPKLNELEQNVNKELSKFEVFFQDDDDEDFDIVPKFAADESRGPTNISTRFMNVEPGENFLCESEATTVYPESGMTRDNNWLFIVNNVGNYKQAVKVEVCKNPGRTCNFVEENIQNGYTTECRQTYTYVKLVAFTSNTSVSREPFKMPTCCKCVRKLKHG